MTHSEEREKHNAQVLQWVQSCLIRLEETRVYLIVGSDKRAGECLQDAAIKMKEAVGLWGLLNESKGEAGEKEKRD